MSDKLQKEKLFLAISLTILGRCFHFAILFLCENEKAVQVGCILAGANSTEVYISGANAVHCGLKGNLNLN